MALFMSKMDLRHQRLCPVYVPTLVYCCCVLCLFGYLRVLPCLCVSCLSANICVYTLCVVHVLCACILCVVCMSSALCMCQYFRTCNRDPPVISPTCQPTHQPSWRPFLKTWNFKQIIQNAQPNDGAESWLIEIFGWSCERCPYFLSDQGPICQNCYAGVMLLKSGQHYELLSYGFKQVLYLVKAPHAWVRCAFGNV